MEDVQIGENVIRARGEVTQTALAHMMRDRGHKWTQNTVWLVEKGERSLKLREAVDVAHVLGVSTESLIQSSGAGELSEFLSNADISLTTTYAKCVAALTDHLEAYNNAYRSAPVEVLDYLADANPKELARHASVLAENTPAHALRAAVVQADENVSPEGYFELKNVAQRWGVDIDPGYFDYMLGNAQKILLARIKGEASDNPTSDGTPESMQTDSDLPSDSAEPELDG